MARLFNNYLIKIDDLFLTDDGTETGRVCKNTITGAESLLLSNVGNTQIASDGTPYNEFPLIADHAGREFSVLFPIIDSAIYALLKGIIEDLAEAAAAPVRFLATTGTPGNIDVYVIGNYSGGLPLTHQNFDSDSVFNVTVRFVTAPAPPP